MSAQALAVGEGRESSLGNGFDVVDVLDGGVAERRGAGLIAEADQTGKAPGKARATESVATRTPVPGSV